jgi:hypothetical protein
MSIDWSKLVRPGGISYQLGPGSDWSLSNEERRMAQESAERCRKSIAEDMRKMREKEAAATRKQYEEMLDWNRRFVAEQQARERSLRTMPDGPAKERVANGVVFQSEPYKPSAYSRSVIVKCTGNGTSPVKVEVFPLPKPIPLAAGDHVMLRLSPVEEQRCVVAHVMQCDHTVMLEMFSPDGRHGDGRWFDLDLVAKGDIRKVDPIATVEPKGKPKLACEGDWLP